MRQMIDRLACAATCWLLLATPFVVFLKYYDYPFARLEIALCAGIAAVVALVLGVVAQPWKVAMVAVYAALITLFADIQFSALTSVLHLAAVFVAAAALLWPIRDHATRVVGLMAATMLISTVLLPSTARPPAPAAASGDAGNPSLPFVLHLVLDEHLGVDAFPSDADSQQFTRQIRQFFGERGFTLFPRAYSEHFATFRSLSHLMNYASHRFDNKLYRTGAGDFEYTLTRNAHFRSLRDRGYRVHAYQSNHINYCTPDVQDVDCTTYNFSNISAIAGTSLSVRSKASTIGAIYTSRTTAYEQLRDHYEAGRVWLRRWVELPRWRAKANNIGPILAMDAMRQVRERVVQARRGEYVYAHLLLPHGPYAFDAGCQLRPPADWLQSYVSRVGDAPVNTKESRALRYDRYLEQLTCVYSTLAGVLDAIPGEIARDAVIMLQGDHGSRITILEPNIATVDRMTTDDFTDSYATLFAVRAPGLPGGERPDVTAITCALASLSTSNFTSIDGIAACPAPEVYVAGNAEDKAAWTPLRGFDVPAQSSRSR